MASTGEQVEEEEDEVVRASRATLEIAKELRKAICEEKLIRDKVENLSAKMVEAAEESLSLTLRKASQFKSRPSFHEFANMLGEEIAEAVEEKKEEAIKYAERNVRKARSLIEDHFHIDEAFRMLGPLQQDSNFARDVHDWFNLVALVPVVFLNFANWSCPDPFFCGIPSGKTSLSSLWNGQCWEAFWWISFAYFVVDMLFVVLLPNCVKSPTVIIVHHCSTMVYMMVPKYEPRLAWLMGSCMIVEVNTWFLIARRSFNRKGEKPFAPNVSLLTSLRLMLVSCSFYITWFAIRIFFYPYLLVIIIAVVWDICLETNTYFLMIAPIIQVALIFLNVKWTVDLVRSKLKGKGKSKGL